MNGLLEEVLKEFGVESEEELRDKFVRYDFIKKVEDGSFSYDDFICLGYLDVEDAIDKIGLEKAVEQGIISKAEAIQYEKETKLMNERYGLN